MQSVNCPRLADTPHIPGAVVRTAGRQASVPLFGRQAPDTHWDPGSGCRHHGPVGSDAASGPFQWIPAVEADLRSPGTRVHAWLLRSGLRAGQGADSGAKRGLTLPLPCASGTLLGSWCPLFSAAGTLEGFKFLSRPLRGFSRCLAGFFGRSTTAGACGGRVLGPSVRRAA